MTYASDSGPAPLSGFSALSAAISSAAASRLTTSTPSSVGSTLRSVSRVSSTGVAESARMNASRSAGYAGPAARTRPPP